jgi:hypothetical protein
MTAARRVVALVALAAIVASGCAGARGATFPPLGSTPGTVGDATAQTIHQVVGALAAVGLQAAESNHAFRPPEGALLAAAPRSILQVTLPDDPTHGYIVVYALASPEVAQAAAAGQAAYVATGPGSVLFAPGTHFVLRVVGPTAIFFTWSPENAPDARTRFIEDALSTIGTAVAPPA